MKFNDLNHTYINDSGVQYLSATSFVKKFVKPFDRDHIAAKFAKKNKRTIEDVINEWKKVSDEAIKKGIAYHKLKEEELLESGSILIEDQAHSIIPPEYEGETKVSNSLKLEPGVYPELIVWSDRYKIAGQADYIEITKSGKINITDYKTSKEIKKNAFKRWDGSMDMMSYPLNNFEDCNFNHYCIQINLYAFLIKQHNRNLKIGNLSIEHVICDFNKDTNSVEIKEVVKYEVPNLQAELKSALDYFKEKQEFLK
jgi:hypothetical protein